MGLVSMFWVFFFILGSVIFQLSQSATVVVDGVSEWKNPTVQIGDSIIFQHKYQYNLYIFQNQNAFNVCNFTQATLLTKSDSKSYTWHPSRPSLFYFSFNNGSNAACLQGQKLAIKVSLSTPAPEQPPAGAPPVISGGVVSSSPAYPWPFQPRETTSPSPAPSALFPANGPMLPEKGGDIPFINSNPAVPLPTGEVDSATIRPLTTSGSAHPIMQVVGFSAIQKALCCAIFLMLL
ncbi:early nodulin-like protein 3 [Nicotiana sylvestris]|uniref:Early nodulin-like protein 1 n=1 Tax=Nicotiana sylvestris TaxID=4096 RepID=A0A1U7YXD2_NICSY|nr:PREDICTED: early nodulin-like protein 1 [Nicotiana sylvestris]